MTTIVGGSAAPAPSADVGRRLERTASGLAGVFGFSVLSSLEGWPTIPGSVWELIQFISLVGALTILIARRQVLRIAPLTLGILGGYAALTLTSTIVLTPGDPAPVVWQKLLRGLVVGLTAYMLGSTRRQLRAMTWGAILGAAVVALGGVTGQVGLGALDPDSGRLAGPVGDPNFFAQFQAVGFALAARHAIRATPSLGRTGASIAAGLCLLAIVVSESRGGLIAAVVTLCLLIPAMGRPGRRRMIVAMIAAGAVILTTPTGDRLLRSPDSVSTTLGDGTAEDTAVAGRLSENIAAVRMFVDHPVLGVGYGGFPRRYLDYSFEIQIDDRTEEREAHNLHLEILAETGAVGALFWLGVVGVVLGGLATVRRTAPSGRLVVVADAWRLGFISFAITSVFLHDSFPNLQWFLVATALAVQEAAAQPDQIAPSRSGAVAP
ncbi:MAG: O-antigen ligase family protein [Acidimicrobiales bacterium]